MGDQQTKDVDVTLPGGKALTMTVPAEWTQDFIVSQLEARRPDLTLNNPQYMAMKAAKQASAQPQQAGTQMQTSAAPGAVRGATSTLPVLGGMGGAVAGAPAFGGGAVVGGALGAAGGAQAKLLIDRSIFGKDETSPISKAGLTETATAGLIGGASEIPGAIAQGYGNVLLKRLAQAKAPEQVGDVLKAFKTVNPAAGTKAGLQEGLETAQAKLSKHLSDTLSQAQGSVQFDTVVTQNALRQAAIEDAGFSRTLPSGRTTSPTRVTNMMNDAIAAAKSNAGITGNTANAQQLAAFQQEIQDRAFKVGMKNPTVGSVVQRLMKDNLYRDAGNSLRVLAPDSMPILQHMTDIHAGLSALKNVGSLGKAGPVSVSAALNPRITAVLSPLATAATAGLATQAAPLIKQGVRAVTTP